MSQPPPDELDELGALAEELRESYSARSYQLDVVAEMDRGFDNGDVRSALERGIVIDAVGSAAGRVGVDFRPVNGKGRELRFASNLIDRRYRVRRARRRADGEIIVPISADSALADHADDADLRSTLFGDQALEDWLYLWLLSPDHGTIDEILAAEVIGVIEGRPGRLKLGSVISLGVTPDVGPRRFEPTDEDLDLGDDDEGEDTGEGIGA